MNNARLRQCLGAPKIVDLIKQAQVRWLGHMARVPDSRLPKQMLFGRWAG